MTGTHTILCTRYFCKNRFGDNKKRFLQSVRNVYLTAFTSEEMIPVVGVEPTLQRNTILSRARLPIPPIHIIEFM